LKEVLFVVHLQIELGGSIDNPALNAIHCKKSLSSILA